MKKVLLACFFPLFLYLPLFTQEVLQLHLQNPHYFQFQGRPTLLVGSGEHYGAVINPDFDYKTYLRTLAADGLNTTRLFTGAYIEKLGDFGIAKNTLAPAPGRALLPWRRGTTPGYALGGDKFDLDAWDEAYFTRLKDFMTEARRQGVIVEITLFSSHYGGGWNYSALNPKNNVNKTDDIQAGLVNTLDNGNLLSRQEQYVRKLVRELNAFGNLYFEIQNEPWADQSDLVLTRNEFGPGNDWRNSLQVVSQRANDWQRSVAAWIVDEENRLPNRHLISQNISNFSYPITDPDPNVSIFNFHYALPAAVTENYHLDRVIGFNETGFAGGADSTYRRQAWRFLMAGGGLFNHLDYSFSVGSEEGRDTTYAAPGGGSPALRRQFAILKRFIDRINVVELRPDPSVIRAAPGARAQALSDGRSRWAIYLEPMAIQAHDLTLHLPPGIYQAEWIDVVTGETLQQETVASPRLRVPVAGKDLALLLTQTPESRVFLRAEGTRIVDGNGANVLLRGIGLGGWMLQEGYMLRVNGEGQQHKIRARIEALIGPEKTQEFYDAWLANHMRRIDVDSLKAWGFNSVRLPMHYNLFTLPVEEESVPGRQTWLERGFALSDSLLAWCRANEMYLILDLHAAPGGQGHDNNISDRDPAKPSLWESEANREKMVALWRRLAERYAGEPWLGAYDIINEPNWGFAEPEKDPNGLRETGNEPLKQLMVETTKAIREVDPYHLIIIEGNGWGNNYNGILPPWDDNMVLSFHKYWNYNDESSIRHILQARERYQVPVWLGETGENSNTWFAQAIRLFEDHNIGWAWWPLKKLGFNNPLEIRAPEGYQKILDHWRSNGPQPSPEEAYQALMQLADNARLENCLVHRDVIDAMFRQVRTTEIQPFRTHAVPSATPIPAVEYDLGRNGYAYTDRDTANYYLSTGGERQAWNHGRTYRNDGVDISAGAGGDYFVSHMEAGEWLQYTIQVERSGSYMLALEVAAETAGGSLSVTVNGKIVAKGVAVPTTGGAENWSWVSVGKVSLAEGEQKLRVYVDRGGFHLRSIRVD